MGLELKNDIDTCASDGIDCPLVNGKILNDKCLETTMAVAGFMNENMISNKLKEKDNWKDICKNCKNFSF